MKKGLFWGLWFVLVLIVGAAIVLPKNIDPGVSFMFPADYRWVWWIAILATLLQVLLFGIASNQGPEFYFYSLFGLLCVGFFGTVVIVLLMNGIAMPLALPAQFGAGVYLASALLPIYTAFEANDYFKPKLKKK
jgi:hypothetical protein